MTKPHGRDQVVRALLDAAAELFAKRGASAVSVREVAAAADVNHGLVHRHFGSKSALVRAVMTDLTQQIAASGPLESAGPSAFLATAARGAYYRVLARALLDGVEISELQQSFPVISQLLAQAQQAHCDGELAADLDPRIVTAMGVALGLGWMVFEPFVLAATGLKKRSRSKVRAEVFATYRRLLRA